MLSSAMRGGRASRSRWNNLIGGGVDSRPNRIPPRRRHGRGHDFEDAPAQRLRFRTSHGRVRHKSDRDDHAEGAVLDLGQRSKRRVSETYLPVAADFREGVHGGRGPLGDVPRRPLREPLRARHHRHLFLRYGHWLRRRFAGVVKASSSPDDGGLMASVSSPRASRRAFSMQTPMLSVYNCRQAFSTRSSSPERGERHADRSGQRPKRRTT